jgi:hypothetical protein
MGCSPGVPWRRRLLHHLLVSAVMDAMAGGSAVVSSGGLLPICGLGCHFLSLVPIGHLRMLRRSYRAKFLCFNSYGYDASGCRFPLEDFFRGALSG